MSSQLEQIIRKYAPVHNVAANGWWPVLCKVCNDHGRKGLRAGFHFDGSVTKYRCFNCGIAPSFDENGEHKLSRDFVKVLKAFGVPNGEWNSIYLNQLTSGKTANRPKQDTSISYEPDIIKPLPFFRPMKDMMHDEVAQWAAEYLKAERAIDWNDYPFMVVDPTVKHPLVDNWYGRLVIPVYKNNNLIFYQGRDLTGRMTRKYLSANQNRVNVLYGFDSIADRSVGTDTPLYVTEGWFDAYHTNGVALFGNILSPGHIYWLNRTSRPKVIIPDKFGNGKQLATAGLSQGWSVALPDIGNCKDVDEAIQKYGKLYTLNSLREHTYSGFQARALLEIYCND